MRRAALSATAASSKRSSAPSRAKASGLSAPCRFGPRAMKLRSPRNPADMFAVQDAITEAIVAAIEPQLYAAENFRARRKSPESLDAWELVMRALSHYWRVTREDNLAAQRLLEQAIAIDPNYA